MSEVTDAFVIGYCIGGLACLLVFSVLLLGYILS